MLRRLARWVRDPEGTRDEKSNSFAMFIVMLPLLLTAFGLGVDMCRNVYIRSTLQNALEVAVVGGAGAVDPTSKGLVVNKYQAAAAVRQVYSLNRAEGPAVVCQESGASTSTTQTGTDHPSGSTATASTPGSQCWKEPEGAPKITATTVYYAVSERSRNAFLGVFAGPQFQDYYLRGRARVVQHTQ